MISYPLAARENRLPSCFKLDCSDTNLMIGEGNFTWIAGPCAVESEEQFLEAAQRLKEIGVHILRGGIFKPRTSPYTFSGLGQEGFAILEEARRLTGLPIITEVVDIRQLEAAAARVDIIQIGSRNMQNYPLLQEVGRLNSPVLLKRGLSATIEEWLLAAEYILSAGNPRVILCERGIRTFNQNTRNTLDIAAVPLLKELSHLPVIVDPSHATGRNTLIKPIALAAAAAGADGLMIEVHPHPEQALCDGDQSLTPSQFAELYGQVNKVVYAMGRN